MTALTIAPINAVCLTIIALRLRQGETLLPEAYQISFFQGAAKTLHLSRWDRAVAVVAHRMKRTEHYPPRWKVSSFPSPREFAAMGAQRIATAG